MGSIPVRVTTSEQSPLRSKSGSSFRVAGFFVCAPLLLLSGSNPPAAGLRFGCFFILKISRVFHDVASNASLATTFYVLHQKSSVLPCSPPQLEPAAQSFKLVLLYPQCFSFTMTQKTQAHKCLRFAAPARNFYSISSSMSLNSGQSKNSESVMFSASQSFFSVNTRGFAVTPFTMSWIVDAVVPAILQSLPTVIPRSMHSCRMRRENTVPVSTSPPPLRDIHSHEQNSKRVVIAMVSGHG